MKQGRRLIVSNWKMNPETKKDAERIARFSLKSGQGVTCTDIVVCPPFPYVGLSIFTKLPKAVSLGAQDIFPERSGAYTGEVSASMLKDMKVRYVILGHSERRALGESDGEVAKKVRSALAVGVRPIVCVGELTRDHEARYLRTLREQLTASLAGVSKISAANIILAYEPVWAVGANVADDPEETAETVLFLRKALADIFSERIAMNIPILYGGSVTDKNAAFFLQKGGVQGLLLGRASRDAKIFAGIVKASEQARFH